MTKHEVEQIIAYQQEMHLFQAECQLERAHCGQLRAAQSAEVAEARRNFEEVDHDVALAQRTHED